MNTQEAYMRGKEARMERLPGYPMLDSEFMENIDVKPEEDIEEFMDLLNDWTEGWNDTNAEVLI